MSIEDRTAEEWAEQFHEWLEEAVQQAKHPTRFMATGFVKVPTWAMEKMIRFLQDMGDLRDELDTTETLKAGLEKEVSDLEDRMYEIQEHM